MYATPFVSSKAHNFTHGAMIRRTQEPLTEDRIRALAPSVFAESAHDSRSARSTNSAGATIARPAP